MWGRDTAPDNAEISRGHPITVLWTLKGNHLYLTSTHSWPCSSLQLLPWCSYIRNGGRGTGTFLYIDWTWERGLRINQKEKEKREKGKGSEQKWGPFTECSVFRNYFLVRVTPLIPFVYVRRIEFLVWEPSIPTSALGVNKQYLMPSLFWANWCSLMSSGSAGVVSHSKSPSSSSQNKNKMYSSLTY